ncbi:ABC transporter ATP-binding protein [Corynebacterium epidermidicanis]|uniref:Trehalose import ATP-binding protein SugC n=1 Tax=Corynebacterium epidermidicanis TaxID=1050174 RepID=A0A0G3GTF6_9CORY|nr:sn-glycerol-3-phosphate ABC transporter ATP-binding protein UgpC [Corynebacterium epidermidicanis]AKK03830.1 ATPase component of ABC-type sugar transporter [Corynebacterium epidermidicanis]
MATVTFDNVSRIYSKGARPAVDSLNLDIQDGEFICLVGPSGCGKSTSLRMLAGLEPTDAGRILIGGDDATGIAPRDRDVAMVFQNYALYPNMTVAENMGFALRNAGVAKATIGEKVQEAARILQLEEFLDRKPANLSGGQRQRVAMGRAIVRDPKVFLMDEPLSNLDAKLRVSTRSQISSLQRRLGTTTVYVTHDQVEAMTMGDRVAVLNAGVLQQCATPRDIYDHPANAFVAGFIGSPAMNLFTLPLSGSGVSLGDTMIALTPTQDVRSDSEIIVGVRPEDWEINAPEGLKVRVEHVEELGHESYGYCAPVSEDVVARSGDMSRIAVHAPHSRGLSVGDTFVICPLREKIHMFSTATGERI